jgi:hypothetical protein
MTALDTSGEGSSLQENTSSTAYSDVGDGGGGGDGTRKQVDTQNEAAA